MRQSMPTSNIEANLEGDISGQVIVGNNNIQVLADHGGKVSVIVPGERTTPRPRPVPVSILPRRFSGLLDRQSETSNAISALQSALPVEFYGEEGLGKTSLLRNIAHHPGANSLPDGVACISAAGLAAGDLSQELLNVFYDVDDYSFKPTGVQFRNFLQDKKALILLDDVGLTREELERLLMALPGCAFVATSRERRLWGEGRSMAVPGLPAQEAIELFERELGRALADGERASAETLCAELNFNPMLILRAAALAREQHRAITSITSQMLGIAPARGLVDEAIASLKENERQMFGALAALDTASIHAEHLAALTGLADAQAVLDGLQRRGLLQAYESRYSLTSDLSEALQRAWDLTPWRAHVLAYFSSWAEKNKRAHKVVLQETSAIQAILKWAAEEGRWEEVIKLGRAVEDALILGGRWDGWERTLQWMLKAGRALGRTAFVGFALHQLGTRALGLEQKSAAESYLREALNVRESLGDEAGAAVTRNNLDILLSPPPFQETSQLREAGSLKPQSSARLLKLGVISAALLLIGCLAVLIYRSSPDKGNNNSAEARDVELPPVPQLLFPVTNGDVFCASGEGQKQVRLEWSDVTDPSGIKSYEIQLEGGQEGSVSRSSATNTLSINTACQQTYSWRVRAIDGAGNAGNWSEKAIFHVKTLEPDKPGISRFTASPDNIIIGNPVKLCYEIMNASRARIEPSIGEVRSLENNCIEVAPKDTTDYTLIATNDSGKEDRRKVRVTVIKPDPIIRFAPDRETITVGESVEISYEVMHATRIRIEPRISVTELPFKGSIRVAPRQTTVYTLTALGYNEQPHSQKIRIEVKGPVEIISFGATPTKVREEGGEAQLCYVAANAKALQIEPEIGAITSLERGCFTIKPAQTTTYMLTATGYNNQQVNKPFTISVVLPPKILHFKPDRESIAYGESVRLCYGVAQATSASITPRPGRVNPVAKECVTDTPKQTTSYKLTATGADGEQVSEVVQVNVEIPAPQILEFKADQPTVTKPSKVRLCYKVANASSLQLTSSDKEFKPRGLKLFDDCIGVGVNKTTDYTLTASNDRDSVAEKVTVRVIPSQDEDRTPPSATKNEMGWCCLSSKPRIFGSFFIAPQVLRQKCLAVELTEDACIARKGKFFKTKAEACKNCLR